jgi:hypothetical protein
MRFKKKQKKSLEAVDGEKFLLPHIRMKFHLFGWRDIRAHSSWIGKGKEAYALYRLYILMD